MEAEDITTSYHFWELPWYLNRRIRIGEHKNTYFTNKKEKKTSNKWEINTSKQPVFYNGDLLVDLYANI